MLGIGNACVWPCHVWDWNHDLDVEVSVARCIDDGNWPRCPPVIGCFASPKEFRNSRESDSSLLRQVVGVISDTPTTSEVIMLNEFAVYLPHSQLGDYRISIIAETVDAG